MGIQVYVLHRRKLFWSETGASTYRNVVGTDLGTLKSRFSLSQ
jgi:hypothetical protein